MLLNGTVQAVEDFACKFMRENGVQVVIEEQAGNVRLLLFRFFYVQGGIEYHFFWGRATVEPWIDQQIQFITHLHLAEIFEVAQEKPLEIEYWKEMFQGYFTELNVELRKKFEKAETAKPKKPEPGSSPNTWFDYLHVMIERGFDIGLGEIAKEIPLSYGRTRFLHSKYASERGLPRLGKKHNK